MKTIFEYVNISASDSLESYVNKRLDRLYDQYPFIIRGDVFFKRESKNDDAGHICGIRLSAPGPRIYASSDERSFGNAVNETIRDLKDQLQKRKEKLYQ